MRCKQLVQTSTEVGSHWFKSHCKKLNFFVLSSPRYSISLENEYFSEKSSRKLHTISSLSTRVIKDFSYLGHCPLSFWVWFFHLLKERCSFVQFCCKLYVSCTKPRLRDKKLLRLEKRNLPLIVVMNRAHFALTYVSILFNYTNQLFEGGYFFHSASNFKNLGEEWHTVDIELHMTVLLEENTTQAFCCEFDRSLFKLSRPRGQKRSLVGHQKQNELHYSSTCPVSYTHLTLPTIYSV